MNVNKKLDRFKQWAGERMGSEIKTNVSDDFKALELEMGLRQEGKPDSRALHSLGGRRHSLFFTRSGEDAALHQFLCQSSFEAIGDRRQGEDIANRSHGRNNDITWRGL